MNKKSILGTLTIATVFLFSYTIICQAQTVESVTPKQARKWTEQGEWTNGFKATPHKTTDYVEFATQYRKNKELWDKTFRWLAEHDLTTIPVGKYEIDGKSENVYAAQDEDIKEFKEIIDNVKIVQRKDSPIIGIVQAEALYYFDGQKSMKETIDTMKNRIEIYEKENSY